jgi:glutamate dehydrogenase (NAD(P)+)
VPREGLTAFQAVNRYFEEAARLIDLDEEMHSILTSTYREIAVQVPVRLDNGELMVVQGYRVQHNGCSMSPSAEQKAASPLTRRT